ncbi:2OG-Fe(II) oxygenase family protein [Enterovibrio coralii]|uniref:2OG-Fe(II) oxygenase n=1 Tax=Enterovibrio coralii TaxID=294935 RepID=A0A135IDN4_9GAMM|nr:2OG-Fe(II) oxygenase [Enterovibrio coralii]KXF83577.1 2OG-Fe(II) oxygenase [Enterovibrio coralii]
MSHAAIVKDRVSLSTLDQARNLALPSREEMLMRTPAVQQFWDNNRELLTSAWAEWESTEEGNAFKLDESLLNAKLRDAVNKAWEDPTTELNVKDLWEEVAPDVFQCQFFDPERLAELRRYLENVANAEIPLRPPYGIALNRHGAMLDKRSEGYLAAPAFQAFYQSLMDKYMRPVARLLFPEVTGYDSQTFGFSIQYQPGVDTSLRLHTDASAATMNINLNLPGETFTGSEIDYLDPYTREVRRLSFEPGIAMIHRGSVPHAAQPITSGSRTNIVLWLYGDRMQIPVRGMTQQVDAKTRWTVPASTPDSYAPF